MIVREIEARRSGYRVAWQALWHSLEPCCCYLSVYLHGL